MREAEAEPSCPTECRALPGRPQSSATGGGASCSWKFSFWNTLLKAGPLWEPANGLQLSPLRFWESSVRRASCEEEDTREVWREAAAERVPILCLKRASATLWGSEKTQCGSQVWISGKGCASAQEEAAGVGALRHSGPPCARPPCRLAIPHISPRGFLWYLYFEVRGPERLPLAFTSLYGNLDIRHQFGLATKWYS